MEPQLQSKTVVEEVPQRQMDREDFIDQKFSEIDKKLSQQPTREEFNTAIAGLANKEDIARLNNYVHTFMLGVQVLAKTSRWVVYGVVLIGGLVGGVLAIKGLFTWVLGLFGVGITHIK